MKEFNERINPSTTVKIIKSCTLDVLINPIALAKMQLLVDTCNKEVGWLGTAIKNKNSYIIQDVFLFEQEVAATTTEITPEGLSSFAEKILEQPDGVEIWNNMKVWGHSHVNMTVSPSGQDDNQMNQFANIGNDWFIRIIANKTGDFKVDVYDFEHGIEYIDVPWERLISIEEEELLIRINHLYEQINIIKNAYINVYKEPIEKEIKEKVKEKFYTINQLNNNRQNYFNNNHSNYNYDSGYNNYDDYDDYNDYFNGSYTAVSKKKDEEETKETNLIKKFNDLFAYFDIDEIEEISQYQNADALKRMLKYTKYENTFTQKELEQIIEYAKEFRNKYIQKEAVK